MTSFETLEKYFIVAFSKMGIKQNVVAQIHSFMKKEQESVRDGAKKLKKYIERFPVEEKPIQARLISIFLEGLRNKTLHAHFYEKKHTNFSECFLDVMEYDDNFDMTTVQAKTVDDLNQGCKIYHSVCKTDMNVEEVEEVILKHIRQTCLTNAKIVVGITEQRNFIHFK